jgi:hypothetical protein
MRIGFLYGIVSLSPLLVLVGPHRRDAAPGPGAAPLLA